MAQKMAIPYYNFALNQVLLRSFEGNFVTIEVLLVPLGFGEIQERSHSTTCGVTAGTTSPWPSRTPFRDTTLMWTAS